MKRRDLILAGGAAVVVAGAGAATYFSGDKGSPAKVDAMGPHTARTVSYAPGVLTALLDDGATVFVDVYTSWCSTCSSQTRTIDALRKDNPAYDKKMTFVKVDWDNYSNSDFARKYQIQNRSTLLVLRGKRVLGGSFADTRRTGIKQLMDIGLRAT